MIHFVCVDCKKPTTKMRRRGSLDTCRKCVKKAIVSRWHAANPGRRGELRKQWFAANPEATRASKVAWEKRNPALLAAGAADRRARKRNATPPWADRGLTKDLYTLARIWSEATGIEYHVDHIVPLNSEAVCGLHWHGNLQILDGFMNRSKSNRLQGNP